MRCICLSNQKTKKTKKEKKRKNKTSFFCHIFMAQEHAKYFEKNKLTVGDFFLIEWTTIQDF